MVAQVFNVKKGENDGCISTRVYEGGVNTEGFGRREIYSALISISKDILSSSALSPALMVYKGESCKIKVLLTSLILLSATSCMWVPS